MNKQLQLLLLLTLLSLEGSPALSQAQPVDELAPVSDSKSTSNSDNEKSTNTQSKPEGQALNIIVPMDSASQGAAQTTSPPSLLSRPPIPAPPAVTLLSPRYDVQIKDPLSWRTRAYKLRLESSDVKNGLVRGARLVGANFEDTMSALTAVCSSQGITIDSVFDSAGQILAHPNDGSMDKVRIIISVKPVTKTSTEVRIGLDSDSKSLKQISFEDLLQKVEITANEKGLL